MSDVRLWLEWIVEAEEEGTGQDRTGQDRIEKRPFFGPYGEAMRCTAARNVRKEGTGAIFSGVLFKEKKKRKKSGEEEERPRKRIGIRERCDSGGIPWYRPSTTGDLECIHKW
jgi:hypothetical protein